jgi:hypothetical protein
MINLLLVLGEIILVIVWIHILHCSAGAEFWLMFRLSRGHFQVLMEDAMVANLQFFN